MTVTTTITFPSSHDTVVVTVSNGLSHNLVNIDVAVSWNPNKLKLLAVLAPGEYTVIPGGVYWWPRSLGSNASRDYMLLMCRKGMVTPPVIASARDLDADVEVPDQKNIPSNFDICAPEARARKPVKPKRRAKKA